MFGVNIHCPLCCRLSPALLLTDAYLCPRHGVFEAHRVTSSLVHQDSGQVWHHWQGHWYQQHLYPEGLKIEIYKALDHLHHQGHRGIKITLARRYEALVQPHLESQSNWLQQIYYTKPRLYGLPLEFSPAINANSRWQVINFELSTELGSPAQYYPFCTRVDRGADK